MESKVMICVLFTLSLVLELSGSPLKFPEESGVSSNEGGITPTDNTEPRFHHHQHRKKKKKKPGCGGLLHNRFKRAEEGRFFFPILNYYDTNVYVNGGGQHGQDQSESGCGSETGSHFGGLSGFGDGLGNGFGGLGSGLGGGIGNLGSGLGSIGSGLGSGISNIASNFPSIGSGISPIISGGQQGFPNLPSFRPTTRPPAPVRPPRPTSRPPSPPQRPPPAVTTTDPDSEDYDYTDFSTTTRSRPNRITNIANYPILNSVSNGIRPAIDRPQTYFNRYVVRPINRTIREFYSLF